MKLNIALIVAVLLVLPVEFAQAKDIPAQARLFIGSTTVDPEDVNTELRAQSLKEIDSITQYGVEALFPVIKFLDIGLRYSKHNIVRDEKNADPNTDFEAEIKQDTAMAVVRIPFFKTDILRLDAFAGYGGSNTNLRVKTSTQDGELQKKAESGWFASPYSSYGGSLAIGYKRFYFIVEGGIETNKVDGFKRVGNINGNIETVDLSGSYITIGLMFDGVSATRK